MNYQKLLEIAFNKVPLVIYGAGRAGQIALRKLKDQGVTVVAVLDAAAEPSKTCDEVPCFTLSAFSKAENTANFNVLLAIFNPQVDVIPIIEELRVAGFPRILTMIDYLNFCSTDKESLLWLGPSAFYEGKESRIEAGRALLGDDESLKWFDGCMHLRRLGDFSRMPTHSSPDQYMPHNLPRWRKALRLIDCGSYNGDSLGAFIENSYVIESLAAFEPDPLNYATLVRDYSHLNAIFIPCGVSGNLKQLSFEAGVGPSCKIDSEGTSLIQCVSIDDTLPGFAPNLIKMDIEGAELEALQGARCTLTKHRPDLAISIYHKPDHLWEIALWLDSLNLEYRMNIRGHGPNGIDLVLYCHAN